MNTNLKKHKQDWEELSEIDPCWATLSDTAKKNGKWQLEEFLLTGEREIAGVMEIADRLGFPGGRLTALDFGCGMGRLTRPLAKIFDQCYGVDISESMIAQAEELNQEFGNCHFLLNVSDDLQLFPDDRFDMIYTNIVLQHVPGKETIRSYIAEFVRTLKADGLLVFQLPAQVTLNKKIKAAVRRNLYAMCKKAGVQQKVLMQKAGLHPIRINFVSEEEMVTFLQARGAKILEIVSTTVPDGSYRSNTYYVSKSAV